MRGEAWEKVKMRAGIWLVRRKNQAVKQEKTEITEAEQPNPNELSLSAN
jgi:hypothetical protein